MLASAGVAALIAVVATGSGEPTPAEPSGIVVGTPGGAVVAAATPTPLPATPLVTPSATPEPTPPATPEPTPSPMPASTPISTPAQATPPPSQPPTPTPTPIAVAAAGPADAVAAFYSRVADGQFDAAYALWSDRMRATYPRTENLDERFDQTQSITFQQLSVVEQDAANATVQANFVETYDSGSSRQFIGYWRLVLVDGTWLLDEPHY